MTMKKHNSSAMWNLNFGVQEIEVLITAIEELMATGLKQLAQESNLDLWSQQS